MTRSALRLVIFAALCTVAACAGESASSSGAGGGGNVGFGGAQDIGKFRDVLDQGGIPGPETLDANGFFSEHFIELPPPDCGQILCGHAMVSVGTDWINKEHQTALQIAINSPMRPEDLERKPLNLAVVVDTSGSMAGARIDYVKQGLHLLIDELEPDDRLALIEYDSTARLITDFSAGKDPEALHQAVAGLYAGGTTNLYGGLETGLQAVAGVFDPDRQNRVILLSDGLPTAGITADAQIIEMSERYISDGIGLTTIGVGTSFNVELMRGLAERGAGNFYFLEDAGAIDEVFTEELDYFVSPIALDVALDVTPGEHYALGEAVGTNAWTRQGQGARVELPAVFLASRTSADPGPNGRRGGGSAILVHMLPRDGSWREPNQVASVRLSYHRPGSEEILEQQVEVEIPQDLDAASEKTWYSQQAMEKNYGVYNLFLGLRAATRAAEYDYRCALGVLETLGAANGRWMERNSDPDFAADQALIDQFADNLRERGASAPAGDPRQTCGGADLYGAPEGGSYGGGTYDDTVYEGCSAGGGTGSDLAVALILALLAFGRSTRRSAGAVLIRRPRTRSR